MSQEEDGPVYYREIQKNAYLKRIPNDEGGSKLRPLGHKKPPLKPMWTQFCIHNGRTPFLEQYPEASSPAAQRHLPVWRASLRTARHVTASVKPRTGDQYDFLVDTDHGPVRMLAPDWESMQDWVTTLRNKLSELRIVGRGENVYCSPPAPPAPPAPRAAARDPTSPLPPTPPVPPDRVPGIELAPTRPIQTHAPAEPDPETELPEQPTETPEHEPQTEIDISNWDTTFDQPSTSQEQPKTNLAKICGQNICLDDSIFKRSEVTESDEEFFNEIDRVHESVENLCFEGSEHEGYKQRVVVNDGESQSMENNGDRPSNITVIQVSNKEPPHTAIPVLGPETNVFYFDFPKPESANPNFVNIVNTEVNVQNTNEYGTVFAKTDTEYGHLSLTTTVSLTGDKTVNNDSVYERLCLASTSAEKPSPLPVKKLKNQDKLRKSSLPNLDLVSNESNYEYLFLGNARNNVTYTQPNTVQNVSTPSPNPSIQPPVSTQTHSTSVNSTTTVQSESNSRNNHVNSVAVNNDSNVRRIGSVVERSHSQNACDASPRRNVRRVQNGSPKRDGKSEKQDQVQTKPIWKRGLTELSLLTRLRGIGLKRQESPTRQGQEANFNNRNLTSPIKVVHRSRNEARVDSARRRSSSLSNGQSPPARSPPHLQPLRTRQAAALRAEQRRGAALVATIPTSDPPVFAYYNKQVWVAWWGSSGVRCNGRTGDRVCALRGITPKDASHAKQLVHHARSHAVDILFHRVPLGKIYVVNKRDQENLGIKLDNECNITNVESGSPAGRGGLPPPGKWALTEVNNRPINLVKGGEDDMHRLSLHGSEVSLLIQPSPLVAKLRAALKGHATLLGNR